MQIKQTNQRSNERKGTNDYYRVIDNDSGEPMGRLIDISETGFRIITAESLPEKTYHCTLSLPRMICNVREIYIEAALKWCEYNKLHDWFEAGLQLEKLNEHCQEVLQEVIQEIAARS